MSEQSDLLLDVTALPVPASGYHHTRGVYANGDFEDNGVLPEHLQEHVQYNTTMRFGRALFIDGRCAWRGYLSKDECEAVEHSLCGVTAARCTMPYR